LQVLAPAPGRTKVVYIVTIHLEQNQASGLNQYSFQNYHENFTFSFKSSANSCLPSRSQRQNFFFKSEPELELKQIVLAPHPWLLGHCQKKGGKEKDEVEIMEIRNWGNIGTKKKLY
jgi:hypothetical protein